MTLTNIVRIHFDVELCKPAGKPNHYGIQISSKSSSHGTAQKSQFRILHAAEHATVDFCAQQRNAGATVY
jgi:hypothetical protein